MVEESATVQIQPGTEMEMASGFPPAAGIITSITLILICIIWVRYLNRRETQAKRGWRYIREYRESHQPRNFRPPY